MLRRPPRSTLLPFATVFTFSEASLVIRSLFELPLSLLSATVGVAIVLSSVKVMLALAVLPAVSGSGTTTGWLPSWVGGLEGVGVGQRAELRGARRDEKKSIYVLQ